MPLVSLQREPIGNFIENVEEGLTKHFLIVSYGCNEIDCYDKGRIKA